VFVPNPTQSFQNVVNYPDINTRMHDLRLTGTYKLTEGIDFVALVVAEFEHCRLDLKAVGPLDEAPPIRTAAEFSVGHNPQSDLLL